MLRPILDEIFSVLSNGAHFKVHTLAAHLQAVELLQQLDDDPNQDLFKRNFVLMNSLYTLQAELIEDDIYLHIDSMDIYLADKGQAPELNTPLSTYYLDWQNYQTENEEITSLLDSFWQRYTQSIHRPQHTLSKAHFDELCLQWQLKKPLEEKTIRRRWRKLAIQYHPDKGNNDDTRFKQLHNEYQQLLGHIKSI
ncbi:molecular chaperone DnaJ [Pseudoalteromonas phenolica]|uniref:Molecular chaperone DnaJ n=1 Tax=Pseudoalteromonas phenolica TaxID=161398 RepID=A0A4Q7IM46_9GAMM|nr:DNA-J related domain-containing protein [Pseudoalteromonas phenolica]RZQ52950.1 molecular chaperone DnaJ [Pseudoalteromonas phenolica]